MRPRPRRCTIKQIIFDWNNSRWARASVSAQVWALLASPGLDLDTTGPQTGDSLLDSTAPSLDSFGYVGGRPRSAQSIQTVSSPVCQAQICRQPWKLPRFIWHPVCARLSARPIHSMIAATMPPAPLPPARASNYRIYRCGTRR